MKICYVAVLDRVVKYFFEPQIDAIREETNDVTCITKFSDAELRKKLDAKIKTIDISISRNVNLLNLLGCIIKLVKIFRREKYDAIQFTGPSTGLICSIAGRLAGVKKRVYCLWGVRYEGFSRLKRKIFRFLEKTTCKLSTDIIFDSVYNKDFLIKEKVASAKKTCVISKGSACGVDLNVYNIEQKSAYRDVIRTKYGIPKDAFVFGYLGRISLEKGINELLFAMRKILLGDKNVYLLMVGFIEEERGLDSELLEWARTEERVIFTGRQDQPEKFYPAFDLFIFPSHREGFGGGVVQAGACAVPSIVSDIGPLAETIINGKLGYLFPVRDAQALLEIVERVYKDKSSLEELGQDMLQYVQQYFDRRLWMQEYKQRILGTYTVPQKAEV